jgi:hypothetical protein
MAAAIAAQIHAGVDVAEPGLPRPASAVPAKAKNRATAVFAFICARPGATDFTVSISANHPISTQAARPMPATQAAGTRRRNRRKASIGCIVTTADPRPRVRSRRMRT